MRITFLALIIATVSCAPKNTNEAQRIVDLAIEAHGVKRLGSSRLEFDFRQHHYVAIRNGGLYSYQRVLKDTARTVHDFLSNDGFYREINGKRVAVPDTMAVKYAGSINSVIYFATLPYSLNDPAVRKKYLGKTTLDGQPYHKVEVTFKEAGGGEDFQDVFHYWFHEENHTMDFLAYLYYTEGGGTRFRKATRRHVVNGVILQDYVNYKPGNDSRDLLALEELYRNGELEELSKIELRNIAITKADAASR
jgi:hypothetical protein